MCPEINPQVNLVSTTIQSSLCLSLVWWTTLWGLSVPSFFLWRQMVGLIHNATAPSIMSRTLIPCVEGTRCVAQMKLAGRCSQCCFNWSLEPRPSLFSVAFKASRLSSLVCVFFLCVLLSSLLRYFDSLAICSQSWPKMCMSKCQIGLLVS